MKTQVGKWGNSLAIRIPGAFAKDLNLQDGAEIELTRVNGGLMLKARSREYTLRELVGGIKPENLHGETEWGQVVGDESW